MCTVSQTQGERSTSRRSWWGSHALATTLLWCALSCSSPHDPPIPPVAVRDSLLLRAPADSIRMLLYDDDGPVETWRVKIGRGGVPERMLRVVYHGSIHGDGHGAEAALHLSAWAEQDTVFVLGSADESDPFGSSPIVRGGVLAVSQTPPLRSKHFRLDSAVVRAADRLFIDFLPRTGSP